MKRGARSAAGYVIAVTLGLSASGCNSKTSPSSNNNQPTSQSIVATINHRPISTKLFEMYLVNGREALGLDSNTEAGRTKIQELREGIVSELIDRILIQQEAERRGVVIAADKLVTAEQRTAQQFGGEQKYDAYLSEHHLTRDEYREVIRMEVYGELMREEFSKGLAISDEEIAKYYEAHKNDPDQQQPERVTASHILIAARPNVISQQLESEKHLSGDALLVAVRAEIERRRKLAVELRSKAAAGADFAVLARQSSDDPSSRDRGGDLGTFRRNTHHRVFDDAVFALKPGSVSTVVQTDFGFHIIKVSAHDQARPMTLVESTSAIRQRLLTQRQAARLTEWLKEARRTADVQISEPFLTGALKTEFPPK